MPWRSRPSARACAWKGFAGLPTYNRATSAEQYLFVNGRPVRDKLLVGAVRGAYHDTMSGDRHAVVALFVTLDPDRGGCQCPSGQGRGRFRDPGLVRGLIVGALRLALANAGHRAATTGSVGLARAFATPHPACTHSAGSIEPRGA
jgi:DNA mismatch repair protein MutL